MVMVSGTSPELSPPVSCCDGAHAVAASDTTTASAVSCPARRRILEIIAVPSQKLFRSSTAASSGSRDREGNPSVGLGSGTTNLVSISRRAARQTGVHRPKPWVLRPATGPTSRSMLSARPSVGTQLEADDAMDLAPSPACRSSGHAATGAVRLAEAATEEQRPAGGMVLHQSDRAWAVHFLV